MRFTIAHPIQYLSRQFEKQPNLIWVLSIGWMIGICLLAFVWNTGSIGLIDETEPLFAEAARQMTVTGDWITPYFNGETRFDKPPLIYWLMAIAYQTLGVNEWAVRLPSALAAIGLTVFGFLTLRYFGLSRPVDAIACQTAEPGTQAVWRYERQRWLSAWIGSALIALNPQTIVWARTGVSDMLLSGFMGTALLAFFCGYAQPATAKAKPRFYLAFYGLMALAVLAKGPVGLVIPVLIIASFLLYVGQWRQVSQEMQVVRGSLLFLLIAVPWYVLVIQANGETYIESFFGYHNFERFTSVVNRHAAPWFFYFLVVLLGFAPWSVHLPVAIARLRFWQVGYWRQQPRTSHLGIFALIWFGVIFIFFTIAVTKLPSYVLPLLPAAAIILALLWSDAMARPQLSRGLGFSHILNLLFLGFLSWGIFYSANWMGDDPAMPNLPQVMQQSGILIGGGMIWAIAAVIGLWLLLRRQARWLWLSNLIAFSMFIAFTVMPTSFLVDGQRQLPLRDIAHTIVQEQQPGEDIIMMGFQKPSLVFYTQRPILFIQKPSVAVDYIRKMARNEDNSASSVMVVGSINRLRESKLRPHQYHLIQQAGVYRLLRVDLPLRRRATQG